MTQPPNMEKMIEINKRTVDRSVIYIFRVKILQRELALWITEIGVMTECFCGSESDFDACCGPIIGGVPAPTAEALMRSRFTAFAKGELDYIENTHATAMRDDFNRSAAESTANTVKWINLEILDTVEGGADDDTGVVEFAARFKKDGETLMHHERSDFHREDGKWVYVDGQMNPKRKPIRVKKVGRNEPCPCGSGKKYKKCCSA